MNCPLSILSTARPGIGGRADSRTNGGVAGGEATPKKSATQAGEGSGTVAAGSPSPRGAPDPPGTGAVPTLLDGG